MLYFFHNPNTLQQHNHKCKTNALTAHSLYRKYEGMKQSAREDFLLSSSKRCPYVISSLSVILMVVSYIPYLIIKRKMKNTTLSEQFQNIIEQL